MSKVTISARVWRLTTVILAITLLTVSILAVYAPYTSPSLRLDSTGASYSYKIETDGLGWYRAISGTTGAVEFSGTDAAVVIQAALDTSGSAGIFIKGNIDITESVRPTSYQTIQGEGWLSQLHATGDFPVIIVDTLHAVTIKDMSIRGGGNTNSNAHGIKIVTSAYCSFDNLWFLSCRNAFDLYDIYMCSMRHIKIGGAQFESADKTYIGVYSHPPPPGGNTDAEFEDIQIIATISHGMRLESCTGISAKGCSVSLAGEKGIYIGAPSSSCAAGYFFGSNIFVDSEEEAYYFDGTGTTTGIVGPINLDVVYAATSKMGIYGKKLTSSIITNLWFYGFDEDAIKLEGGDRIEISDGFIGAYGTSAASTHCGVRLVNVVASSVRGINFVAANPLNAIREEGTSDGNRFMENDDYTGGGMTVIGPWTIVRNNRGYRDNTAGVTTGTGVQQTIPHGADFTPQSQNIILTSIHDGADPYLSDTPNATNLYITATVDLMYRWEVKRFP